MINANFFIGEPINFNKKFFIYPPTVREVITIQNFNKYLYLLTITQDDLNDEFLPKLTVGQNVPTPFEYILANCYANKNFAKLVQEAFKLFIHQDVTFFYEQKTIIVGNLEKMVQSLESLDDLIMLKEAEYFDFQNMIRQAAGVKEIPAPLPEDPDEDPRVRRIKEKARYRDRIKAKQEAKNGISLSTCLVAICCMGIGITPLNIGEMSYAAVNPLMSIYQNKEKYDIDIRSLLAGADSKKIHPQYWIKNLTE